jgi:hypothetical protein
LSGDPWNFSFSDADTAPFDPPMHSSQWRTTIVTTTVVEGHAMETLKIGTKLSDQPTGIVAIVIRPPTDSTVEFWPGGRVDLGKRYACQNCDSEVLVTKAGPGTIACHGMVMGIAQAKTLPSSD